MALLKIEEPQKNIPQEKADELPIFGIDLGTTNSLIGMIINDEVRFFHDKFGNQLHKSVVAFDDSGNFHSACNEADSSDQKYKIYSIKRLMGKDFDDLTAQKYSFEISSNQDKQIQISLGEKKYLPEEISAKILKYLKNLALKNVGVSDFEQEIKAVITVPAYFDEAAKNATKLAAKLAGIEVLRLVNEPTAAALAYGLDNSKEGIYAVFDLGGGTFDVSILKMQKGVFKVLGVSGNNQLGGDDFDELLAEFLSERFFDKKINSSLLTKFTKKIKEELSQKNAVEISCDELAKALPDSFCEAEKKSIKITRAEFEEIISSKINEAISLTKNLLVDLDLEVGDEKNEVKGVILVGGSSRIPLISRKLSEIFGQAKIFTDLDPDCVVAQGAVLQAFNLSGKGNNLLLDVLPLSLGVEMMGGIVDKIISRNTTIPIAMAKEFTTYADNQTGIKLKIVQGEREFAKDCRALADFEIKKIPPMRAGLARVLVTFKVDADGLLTVMAEEKITGQKQQIEVKPSFGLNENQVKKILLDSMSHAKEDIALRLKAETVREAKQNLDFVKRDLREYGNLIDENERKNIEEKAEKLEELLKNQEMESREKIIETQKNLEKASENFILQKVNKTLEIYLNKNVDDVI